MGRRELRVALAITAATAGCFGQPEDQFTLEGSAFGVDGGVWPGAKVKIERDQGASLEGCSAFADFTSVTTDESGQWRLDVIRQQTRGRLSDHRCFRASVFEPGGRRSAVIFPFTGDDVQVPPLRLWPSRQPFGQFFGPSPGGMFFFTLPDAFKLPGETSRLTYRAEVQNDHGRIWRQGCSGAPLKQTCDIDERARLGLVAPQVRVAALQTRERYGRDPFGQLKVTVFEQRIETGPVVLSNFSFELPFTLGATCNIPNAAGSCALTDGDPRPLPLPLGTFQVEIDLGAPIRVLEFNDSHELFVHGVWVEGEWTRLVVEAQLQDTTEFVQVGLIEFDKDDLARTQVSREDPRPAVDLGPIRIRHVENAEVLGYRKLRIHAVNNLQTVPMVSLGEVAVY